MKPLLVGECNPYQANDDDARRFAFYPEPRHASGGRLCHVILGLTERDYLRSFDRTDLCGVKWSLPEARLRARDLVMERSDDNIIIAFGAKVASAFGIRASAFTVCRGPLDRAVLLYLPHPSGLNRAWHAPGAIDRARWWLRALGVPCAAPKTEAA